MGGRGRGRGGSNMNLNTETLGLGRGDIPATVLAPPPLFPPLVNRPMQIEQDVEEQRLLQFHSNITSQFKATQPVLYDKLDWNYLPKELKVGVKKRGKQIKPNLSNAKRKVENIDDRLKNLEEREKQDKSDDEDGDEEKKGKESDDDEDKKDENEELEEEVDEEMDDGTDYANNYFDNGEGFEDEDDNLDEGGIY